MTSKVRKNRTNFKINRKGGRFSKNTKKAEDLPLYQKTWQVCYYRICENKNWYLYLNIAKHSCIRVTFNSCYLSLVYNCVGPTTCGCPVILRHPVSCQLSWDCYPHGLCANVLKVCRFCSAFHSRHALCERSLSVVPVVTNCGVCWVSFTVALSESSPCQTSS